MNHACSNQDQTPIEECLDCKRQKFIDDLESKLRIAESAIAYNNEIISQLEKLRIAEEALFQAQTNITTLRLTNKAPDAHMMYSIDLALDKIRSRNDIY
jgi:hypothetical protein